MNHTPEPWEYDGLIVYGSNPADLDEVCHVCESNVVGRTKSNIRLITAAPELLEALKDARRTIASFLDHITGCGEPENISGWTSTLDNVEAAIAKAKGEK